MKINEIKHRHYLQYTNEMENVKSTGYIYLAAHVAAGIKAGIIEGVSDIDELSPLEVREIGMKLTAALQEIFKPLQKN